MGEEGGQARDEGRSVGISREERGTFPLSSLLALHRHHPQNVCLLYSPFNLPFSLRCIPFPTSFHTVTSKVVAWEIGCGPAWTSKEPSGAASPPCPAPTIHQHASPTAQGPCANGFPLAATDDGPVPPNADVHPRIWTDCARDGGAPAYPPTTGATVTESVDGAADDAAHAKDADVSITPLPGGTGVPGPCQDRYEALLPSSS